MLKFSGFWGLMLIKITLIIKTRMYCMMCQQPLYKRWYNLQYLHEGAVRDRGGGNRWADWGARTTSNSLSKSSELFLCLWRFCVSGWTLFCLIYSTLTASWTGRLEHRYGTVQTRQKGHYTTRWQNKHKFAHNSILIKLFWLNYESWSGEIERNKGKAVATWPSKQI